MRVRPTEYHFEWYDGSRHRCAVVKAQSIDGAKNIAIQIADVSLIWADGATWRKHVAYDFMSKRYIGTLTRVE